MPSSQCLRFSAFESVQSTTLSSKVAQRDRASLGQCVLDFHSNTQRLALVEVVEG